MLFCVWLKNTSHNDFDANPLLLKSTRKGNSGGKHDLVMFCLHNWRIKLILIKFYYRFEKYKRNTAKN